MAALKGNISFRSKKEAVVLHCNLDKSVSDGLNVLCDETGLSKTKAVERALINYIEEYKKSGKS